MKVKAVVIKNSIFGIVQYSLSALLTLICVPVFIGKLGLESYGVFSLLAMITILGNFSNLGLNNTLLIFLSRQGKSKESNLDILVVLLFTTILVLFLSGILLFFENFILVSALNIPVSYLASVRALYRVFILSNFFLLVGQTFISILDSCQKIYINNIAQFIYNVLYWGGLIVFVSMGAGLSRLGTPILIATFVWFSIILIFSIRIWRDFRIVNLGENLTRLTKKHLSYSLKIYGTNFFGLIVDPLSKMLLSHFVGVQVVGCFEVAIRIRSQVSGLFNKFLYPIFPYIAKNQDFLSLSFLLIKIYKKIQLLVLPTAFLCFFCFPYILKIWLGNEYLFNIQIYSIFITVSYLIFSPPITPVYYYLMAKNKAHVTMCLQISNVVCTVVFFFLFYMVSSNYAIVIASVLTIVVSYFLGIYFMKKYMFFSLKEERNFFRKIIIYVLILSLLCGVYYCYSTINLWNMVIYVLIISIFTVFYYLSSSLVLRTEIEGILKRVPFLNRFLN